jgi:hypothetical protein
MYRGITIEKIRNSPTLSNEKWFSTNEPRLYKKVLDLTEHMDINTEFMTRVEYINKLIVEKKICVLYFR